MMRFFLVILILLSNFIQAEDISDPWEGMNRKVFAFNEKVDQYLLAPVARTYGQILPSPLQKGVTSFFENLSYPKYIVSDLLQFKFSQIFLHTGRFLINSTIGLAGFIDVAEDLGLEEHYEDFAIALAYHEVPAGAYMILPFLGPSNMRDFTGSVVDRFLNPIYWLGTANILNDSDALAVSIGTTLLEAVNARYNLTEAINAGRESSLDYYLFLQSSYYQYREGLVYDGNVPGAELGDDEPDWDEE